MVQIQEEIESMSSVVRRWVVCGVNGFVKCYLLG